MQLGFALWTPLGTGHSRSGRRGAGGARRDARTLWLRSLGRAGAAASRREKTCARRCPTSLRTRGDATSPPTPAEDEARSAAVPADPTVQQGPTPAEPARVSLRTPGWRALRRLSANTQLRRVGAHPRRWLPPPRHCLPAVPTGVRPLHTRAQAGARGLSTQGPLPLPPPQAKCAPAFSR